MAEFELKWTVGAVKCKKCSYEWIAVRPVEAAELECPKCGVCEGRTKIYEQEDTNG